MSTYNNKFEQIKNYQIELIYIHIHKRMLFQKLGGKSDIERQASHTKLGKINPSALGAAQMVLSKSNNKVCYYHK